MLLIGRLMPSEVELTWVVSDSDGSEVSEQYIGALNYWQVFNATDALYNYLRYVNEKITDAHELKENPRDWTRRRDSTGVAYDLFLHMKRRMAADFQRRHVEETDTVDRIESDT